MRSGCLRYLGSRGSISRGREKYHQRVMTFKELVSGRTRKRGTIVKKQRLKISQYETSLRITQALGFTRLPFRLEDMSDIV